MPDQRERLQAALAGHYTIDRELGHGGMAVVYLALDARHDRRVALKVLRPEIAAALGAERFLREIRIAAGLSHPNILPLYDSGDAGGILYYVMPYVEGESLRDRLNREAPMPLAEALAIATETADALGHAHAHDVVHRDVKPENILLSGGHALVADFGIARAINAAGGDQLTETGIAIGTPAYMSPEQATAQRPVDGRADVYALGCVLYEMLAGEPPFSGPSAQAVLARHALDPVPPLRTVRPELPQRLERAVLKALAKTPADRFATAAALREALLSAERSPGRPRAWIAGLTVGLALVGAGAAYVALRARAGGAPPQSVAVLPFQNLSPDPSDEYFSNGMSEELTTALGKVEGLRVAAPTSAGAFRNATVPARQIGRTLGVATLLEGTVRRAGGRLRVGAHLINADSGFELWSDEYERDVRDVFAVQDEITRAIVGALRVKLAAAGAAPLGRHATASPEAHDLYLHGRFFYEKRNEDGLRKALVYFRQAIAQDSGYALAYSGLADTYSFLSAFGFGAPHELFPQAKVAALRALQLDSSLPEAHTSLGFTHLFYDWNWPAADREFRRALALDSTYTPAILYHGWYNVAVGQLDAAVRDLEHARAIDPLSLILNTRLATMLYLARRDSAAVAQLRRTLTLDSTYDLAHAQLARVYLQLGRCDAALVELRGRPRILAPYYEGAVVAYAAAVCGRAPDARRTIDSLAARTRRGLYVSPMVYAIVYAGLGDKEQAFTWLERAFDDRTWSLYMLRVEPMLDPLRGDPRFARLIQRVGLP
ncbi:MAG TPA: protein kinase [Gemmatimonadales bacterium]|nr:protein kinase [Gemmatimonadales bacterium]